MSLNSEIPQSGTADQSDYNAVINNLLDLVSRTFAVQTDVRRKTATAAPSLSKSQGSVYRAKQQAREALEDSRYGVMSINANGDMEFHNSVALEILSLPKCSINHPYRAREMPPQIARLRILRSNENQDVELIEVSPRRFAKLHSKRLNNDKVAVVIEDINFDLEQTSAHRMAEAEYRSLFENAVCGIYRDRLDSTPVRCNPALAILNGYKDESEYIHAVTGAHGAWYVDPKRSDEFKRLMRTDGRVKDFVSEVYRHRTQEKIWITENAWYVRDAEGNPIFIEGTIQDATERITTLAIIEREANLDSLTGAASRSRFLREISEKTVSGKAPCALYCIDLDRFKEVNDRFGHAVGDLVLSVTAKRILSLVREAGIVARLGGDEFAILQQGAGTLAEIELLAKDIVNAMREPISVNGQNLIVGASVGVAMFPHHAVDAEELLSNADIALYQVKTKERGGYLIFDLELGSSTLQRKEVESELKAAIANNQLELYYQPIVNCENGEIISCEALMRWNHPRRGLLLPSQFISIAEDAGLMTELGNWAIAHACKHAALLPPNVKMAVNVSPSQFRSSSILSELRRILEETRLDPKRLILEITETLILSNELIIEKVLDELQDMGVMLALDDFGTAYSSLSYLQQFAFTEVKIDQSFVAGMLELPANLAVIRAVLGIGRDLGIDVIAEGVETSSQVEALAREGCVLMQGYFFGKPKPYLEIVADLAVQRLSRHRPAKDTSSFGGRSKIVRA